MRLLVSVLLGALLGAVLTAWLSARVIHWYAAPPFPIGCDVGPAVKWAIEKLLIWEAIGAGVGAIGLAVLALMFGGKRKAQPPASA